MRIVLSPLRIAVECANACAAPHTGAKPVAALAAWVRLQLTANCLRVPTGRMLLLRLLTRIVRQCGAPPDVADVVVTVSANLRFKAIPRYHNNLRMGRCPRRPLFGLTQTLAPDYCTLLCGCGGCHRLPPRFARRDTQLLAAPYSAGAVRQSTVKSGWHPSALADRCLLIYLIGGTFPNVRGETSAIHSRTPRASP
jgi:hypothetical protein